VTCGLHKYFPLNVTKFIARLQQWKRKMAQKRVGNPRIICWPWEIREMAAEKGSLELTYKFALCRLLPSGDVFCSSSVINTEGRHFSCHSLWISQRRLKDLNLFGKSNETKKKSSFLFAVPTNLYWQCMLF